MKRARFRATLADRLGGPRGDAGFTLIELLISLVIVSMVGTFAASLQMASSRAVRTEANRQLAAQLVARNLDKARGLGGDAAADLAGDSTEQIDGLALDVNYAVDPCWQVLSADGKTPTCGATEVANSQAMDHIIVTVSWREGTHTLTQRGDITIDADPVFAT